MPRAQTHSGEYNPLEKQHLAESIARALLDSELHPLPPERFSGAGVYALYYKGNAAEYQPLIKRNSRSKIPEPIYVGKAVPSGARKGVLGEGKNSSLIGRLREHARTIDLAENLETSDFRCRYLVVDEIFIPLGESLLINRFRPVWNVAIEGFGIHTPGKGRLAQKRSMWDILHPGRGWVAGLGAGKLSLDELKAKVNEHFHPRK
jgi:hypothetical protein